MLSLVLNFRLRHNIVKFLPVFLCRFLKGGDSLYQTELGAYLRSLGLSVGKKLCFFLCAYMCLSFCAIIDLSCNCFLSCYARDAGFFTHVYRELETAFVLKCKDPFLGWGGGS